jgi:hypothetical protein
MFILGYGNDYFIAIDLSGWFEALRFACRRTLFRNSFGVMHHNHRISF